VRPVVVLPGVPSVARTKRLIVALVRDGVTRQNALTAALRRILPDLPCSVFGDAVTELLRDGAITIQEGTYRLPSAVQAGPGDLEAP
jgi:hypothetical protein